jgi:hypothetical protein
MDQWHKAAIGATGVTGNEKLTRGGNMKLTPADWFFHDGELMLKVVGRIESEVLRKHGASIRELAGSSAKWQHEHARP